MKPTHDSLLLRVSCLRTHQTVFLSDECVTGNHVLVSLASSFYIICIYIYIYLIMINGSKISVHSLIARTLFRMIEE